MGELFQLKYKEINHVARLITRNRNIRLAPDLINTTYLRLHKSPSPNCPDQFLKWFCRGMKLEFIAERGEFNKLISKAKDITFDIQDEENELENLEIDNYKTPSNLNLQRAIQYTSLLVFKKSLPLHEQVIFDLFYLNSLSARDITKQLKIEGYHANRNNITKIVNSIKNKLEKWKTANKL